MVLPLFVTPHVARALGVAGNGLYAMSSTVACYFIMFGKLGLDNYGNRTIAFCRDDPEARSRAFSGIYCLQLVTSAVSIALYAAMVLTIVKENRLIYWMQLLYVLSILFDVSWLFYGMEKFRLATARSLISRGLLIAAVFLFVKDEGDLWVYALVMSLSFLFEQAMLFPFAFRHVRFVRVSGRDVFSHLKPNLKLFVPLLALSVYNWMDKIMLGLMRGEQSVAYYNYAESIVNLPKGIVVALGTVMLPRLSHMAANNEVAACRATLKKSMRLISFLSCALCFGIAGVSPVFVPLFLGPEYTKTILLTIELAAVMIPMSITDVTQTQYLIPFKRERIYIQSVALGAATNLAANFLLIPSLEASGAVIGTICAETAVCLYQLYRIRDVYSARDLIGAVFPFLFCGAVQFVVTYSMRDLAIAPFLLIALLLIVGGGTYLLLCFAYYTAFRGGFSGLRRLLHRG
jgi:O-antigen/teichoic acid export membrane protein